MTGPLPPSWEARMAPDGKGYYANHDTKKTTWEDPRMGFESDDEVPPPPNYNEYPLKQVSHDYQHPTQGYQQGFQQAPQSYGTPLHQQQKKDNIFAGATAVGSVGYGGSYGNNKQTIIQTDDETTKTVTEVDAYGVAPMDED